MHPHIQKILFTQSQIEARVEELASQLNRAFAGKTPLIVCVLKGAVIFFADLVRRLNFMHEQDFMAVSTYGLGTVSGGKLNIKKDLDTSPQGREVIIVEDIIDSGFTLYHLKNLLLSRGASSVTVVTLLNKPSRRTLNISADYFCFCVPDEFVVGYGLDYAQKYRSLPYIGVLKPFIYQK